LEWLNKNRRMIDSSGGAVAFEDEQPTVDMWRENGVFCFHVVG
jgi:hypothetical protein